MTDEILTEKEAAAFLKVSHQTLAKWRRAGKSVPKHSRVEGEYRYLKSEVINYIKEHQE